MPTAVADLCGAVGAITDEEQRDIAWGQVTNRDKTGLIAAVRNDLGAKVDYQIVDHTAKLRWWAERGKPDA